MTKRHKKYNALVNKLELMILLCVTFEAGVDARMMLHPSAHLAHVTRGQTRNRKSTSKYTHPLAIL